MDQSKPRDRASFEALEEQLERVMERDGVTMQTPMGTRKRAARRHDVHVHKLEPTFALSHEDPMASMDKATVEFVVRSADGGRERPIAIQHAVHEPSRFVVSLQQVLLSEAATRVEERVPVHEALSVDFGSPASQVPVDVFATLSRDLIAELPVPQKSVYSSQFTGESFEDTYRKAYHPLARFSHALGSLRTSFATGFRRVERAEQHVVETVVEMEESLGVVEPPRLSWSRALTGFAVLALVVTLPAQAVVFYRTASDQKDEVSVQGQDAVDQLKAIQNAGAVPGSVDALRAASSKFREADALMSQTGALALGAASVLPKQYRSARALFEIGDKSSEAARLVALGYEKVYADPGRRLDERFDVLGAYSRSALLLLSDARKAAATVDVDSIPEPERTKVKELLPKLEQSTQAVQEISAVADVLSALVGKESMRKYLVIFQNPTELRATGGFMGSLAEVTFDKGNIQDLRFPQGGTYDLKGQLTARVQSPKPLQLINAQWQFQDANWFPDFPKSAEKLRWFWSKSGQPTLDGVIAVNATFVEKLLAVTGPIDLPEYGKTIDASNFMMETQKAVELEYDRVENSPKKFIGDLAVKLQERIKGFSKEEWLNVAGIVSESLDVKDIQIALVRSEEEQIVERYGWSGRMKPTTGDALALIETNIAGQKTDGVVEEDVKHTVRIAEDGSIEDTVELTRTHKGNKGELFRGVRNVSYLRAYVPKGASLIAAAGFRPPNAGLFKIPLESDALDIDVEATEAKAKKQGDVDIFTEDDRTVFGGWMQLDPGETQTIRLTYRLPFTAQELLTRTESSPEQANASRAGYLLLLTSQSGKSNRHLTSTIEIPASWKATWTKGDAGLTFDGLWDRDRVMAALLTPAL